MLMLLPGFSNVSLPSLSNAALRCGLLRNCDSGYTSVLGNYAYFLVLNRNVSLDEPVFGLRSKPHYSGKFDVFSSVSRILLYDILNNRT